MTGGSKRQYKQFTISSAIDGCLALQTLISGVICNLKRYKQYSEEAKRLYEDADSQFIPADIYEEISDKLLYRQHEILKYTADNQITSFSYNGLRKLLMKQKYLSEPLTEELTQILNELLYIRNWTFHNPQSNLVAARDAMEKRIPYELRDSLSVVPQINPVIVPIVDSYELAVLASLINHTKKRTMQFESVLESMKEDYQVMVDSMNNKPFLLGSDCLSSAVQYMEKHMVFPIAGISSDVSQISMAIQKSKYDGISKKTKE